MKGAWQVLSSKENERTQGMGWVVMSWEIECGGAAFTLGPPLCWGCLLRTQWGEDTGEKVEAYSSSPRNWERLLPGMKGRGTEGWP